MREEGGVMCIAVLWFLLCSCVYGFVLDKNDQARL